MDRINKVISARKHIKNRESAHEKLANTFDTKKVTGKSVSYAALPAIKHQKRDINTNS